jgi:hypothetical protein
VDSETLIHERNLVLSGKLAKFENFIPMEARNP